MLLPQELSFTSIFVIEAHIFFTYDQDLLLLMLTHIFYSTTYTITFKPISSIKQEFLDPLMRMYKDANLVKLPTYQWIETFELLYHQLLCKVLIFYLNHFK